MRHRSLAAVLLASLAVLTLSATSVLAGGWADVKPDAGTLEQPPIEGESTVIGFTILQHGVTPAGWITPTVILTDLASGERMEVAAPAGDEQGHFAVPVTLPRSGLWTWTVAFDELAHDGRTFPLTVRLADGSMPAVDPGLALSAVQQVKSDVTAQMTDTLSMEIGRIDTALSLGASYDERHTHQLTELTAERDALAARVEALEAGGGTGTSMILMVLLAVLAGAAAGFAMSWLGSRTGTREIEVSPAPATSPQGSPTA
jgi:hypothetical protein